jgi:hypothetical protein
MKAWQWILLAGGAVVVIIFISRSNTATQQNGAVNGTILASAGLGGLLAGIFSGSGKVSAPSATAGSVPGDTGYSYNGLSGQAYGSAYSQAMGNTGAVASNTAGPASTASADAGATGFLGSGGATPSLTPQLTAPSFDIGTSGADFSN